MSLTITAMHFSPTRTTARVTWEIAKEIKRILNCNMVENSLLHPAAREKTYTFGPEDILVLGMPVHGGRIPLTAEPVVESLKGTGTLAIINAVYGNRDFDDALLEMKDHLEAHGFKVIAAGAFIGEHSFTPKLGTGRPDTEDLQILRKFGEQSAAKISEILDGEKAADVEIPGTRPYKERKPIKGCPGTTDDCYDCMTCVNGCPTEAIDFNDPRITDASKCIMCFACVKSCPVEAKVLLDEELWKVIHTMENLYSERKDPKIFI